MRAVFSLAVAMVLGASQPLAAQDRTPPQGPEPPASARTREPAPKPAVSTAEKEGAAARARHEARERTWDDKMKRTMRSICSGAQGC